MFVLRQTCGACPEAYNVYRGDEYVGYMRLRHGSFSVVCEHGGAAGEVVYSASPRGDGCFESDERDRYLNEGCKALLAQLGTVDGNLFSLGDPE